MNLRSRLLSLLSSAPSDPAVFESMSDADWRELYSVSCDQGVSAIVRDAVERAAAEGVLPPDSRPPKDLRIRWALNAESVEAVYSRQRAVVAKLARFFADPGIGMMVLKGYGLSLCYPRPNHRPCGDVDIWLFEERRTPAGGAVRVCAQRRGDALLRERMNISVDEGKHRHTTFYVDGVPVENHYDFLNVHAHRSNRIIESRLKESLRGGLRRVEIDGAVVWLPPSDFHALFLLRHSAEHFAADRIALRHLLDWGYFAARHGDEIDWHALETLAEEMNMHRFLHSVHSICVGRFAMPLTRFPLSEPRAEDERRVLDEILRPEFSEAKPRGAGYLVSWSYMLRRWLANRRKHGMVYRESSFATFFTQLYSHLLKPESLKM